MRQTPASAVNLPGLVLLPFQPVPRMNGSIRPRYPLSELSYFLFPISAHERALMKPTLGTQLDSPIAPATDMPCASCFAPQDIASPRQISIVSRWLTSGI